MLHWYKSYVIAKLSVHHSAAVDLERNESGEKTWTPVPSTVRIKGHHHQELVRRLLRLEVASVVPIKTQCENERVTASQANSRMHDEQFLERQAVALIGAAEFVRES